MFDRNSKIYSAPRARNLSIVACALSILNLQAALADQKQTAAGTAGQSQALPISTPGAQAPAKTQGQTATPAKSGVTAKAGVTAKTGAVTKTSEAAKTVATTKASAAAKTGVQPQSRTTLNGYLDGQLAREKDKHHQYFEGLAKNATETGQYQADRLRAQAAGKRLPAYVPDDNAYQPMSARVPGYTPSQTGLPQRSPVYVSQDLEWAKMKEDMAAEKAAALRKVAAEKEAAMEQSMANMKSQMKQSHVPGAAVARPDGSNLFVRYYGPSNPNKPYEVHPAAARIIPMNGGN